MTIKYYNGKRIIKYYNGKRIKINGLNYYWRGSSTSISYAVSRANQGALIDGSNEPYWYGDKLHAGMAWHIWTISKRAVQPSQGIILEDGQRLAYDA